MRTRWVPSATPILIGNVRGGNSPSVLAQELPRTWECWPVPFGRRRESGGGSGKRTVFFSEVGKQDHIHASVSPRTSLVVVRGLEDWGEGGW